MFTGGSSGAAVSEELQSMKDRLNTMSERTTAVMREKTALNQEIEMLKIELKRFQVEQFDTDVIKAVGSAREQHYESAVTALQSKVRSLSHYKHYVPLLCCNKNATFFCTYNLVLSQTCILHTLHHKHLDTSILCNQLRLVLSHLNPFNRWNISDIQIRRM